MFKYDCQSWYGYYKQTGISQIQVDQELSEDKIINIAKKSANSKTGSTSCNIQLLQQFELSIKSIKNFSGLATIPITIETNSNTNI
tara:strand:+ start:729 stop:986 length:258 start_codon:yes stop_codon:yes gene_type:complete